MDIQGFLSRLDGVRQTSPDQYEAKCPAHDDSRQSLSVGLGEKGILVHCHANCDTATEVLPAIGLTMRDLQLNGSSMGTPEEHYDYTTETFDLLYQVVRKTTKAGKKKFLQRKPGDDGRWVYKLNGVRRVPYRLPRVLKAVQAGETIYIPEGEKDVHTLERFGLAATCNSGGAGKWLPEFAAYLKGADVVVLPDNDKAGREHGLSVAASLLGIAASVRIVELPVPEKGDVTDWFFAGGTAEALGALVCATSAYTPAEPKQDAPLEEFPLTDYGNAERLVDQHGSDVRYCYPLGTYLVWDGVRWGRDESGEVMRMAKYTCRSIREEAAQEPNKNKAGQIFGHALKSESEARLNAMISLARSEPGIPIRPDSLDTHLYLLNLENGTLNLQTGRLIPHSKTYLITKLAPVAYDANARAPRFYKFMEEIFGGDEDLIGFMQRLLGYALTGDTSEQVFPILYGRGANGKTTLIEIVRAIMGDLAAHTPTDTLSPKRGAGIPNDLARLRGARFVSAVETSEGRGLDENLIKQITGGEPITARFLRQEFFEFRPEFKVFLATNHRPQISGTDNGIWRRLRLIPFEVTIAKDEQDEHLDLKLWDERAGILNWMLEGCLDWQSRGLATPEKVLAATASYRTDMDVLSAFIEECCNTDLEELSTKSSALYGVYKTWCENSGEKEMNKRNFGMKLSEHGFSKKRMSDGNYYQGIAIKQN